MNDKLKSSKIKSCSSYKEKGYDALIFISDSFEHLPEELKPIENAIKNYSYVNPGVCTEISVVPFNDYPCKRIIYSPVKSLNVETADSRDIITAAALGMKKSVDLRFRNPVVVIGSFDSSLDFYDWAKGKYAILNVILGCYQSLYTPIELLDINREEKFDSLTIFNVDQILIDTAYAIEEGRRIARDIGGSDPERMSAPRIAEYLTQEFKEIKNINISIKNVNKEEYPLMAAVNRAAETVERHRGRVVTLTYIGEESSDLNEEPIDLFLVGKGITYDTGGADIKAGGIMAGMHRDKCGAAAICGILKTLSMLKPKNIKVTALLAFVRNSVGEESYVADEIITSRAGVRVRIGNTDAEGRMVMADLLCQAKEMALTTKNPYLFTVATLTGHVIRAYKDFAAVLDNGPAKRKNMSISLQEAGDKVGDICEISTIRKDDYEFNKGKTEYEDVIQCNNLPSSATPRGHQIPAAFLVVASGLSNNGLNSTKPLPYTHIDVAGSAAEIYKQPTASPLLMLVSRFVLSRTNFNTLN